MHLRHDWEEVGREFNPPQRPTKLRNVPPETIEQVIHGFTQVEYACQREGCSQRRIVEYIGRLPERSD